MGTETAGNKTLWILNHSSDKGLKLRPRETSSPLADQSGNTRGNSASRQKEHHSAAKFTISYNSSYSGRHSKPVLLSPSQVRQADAM